MKRVSKKQQLVDYMLAAGNPGFTYTEVIKTLLKLHFGDGFKYDSSYRGYYSCAISGNNNYLMNGSGKCGLVKRNGKYFAKYFDKYERMHRAKTLMLRNIDYVTTYNSYRYPLTAEGVISKGIDKITRKYFSALKSIQKQTA